MKSSAPDSTSSLRLIIGVILAVMIYFGVLLSPLSGFSQTAHTAIAVFCVAAFLWISNILPIAITGIVVLLLLPLSGTVSAQTTYSFFGNSAVFFVLGAFILVSPVMRSGLSTRFAITLITKVARGPKSLLLAVFLLASGLTFIISEHAVAAMLFPIVIEIIEASGIDLKNRFGFALILAMGWGAIIGGTATLLGGARGPLALGILEQTTGHSMTFLSWIHYALPATLAMLILAGVSIFIVARKSTLCIKTTRSQLQIHHNALGKLSQREILTAIVLIFTVILWVCFGTKIGLDLVAFIGVILVFILKLARWHEVEEDVPWSIFLVYGSAIALGSVLKSTGAAHDLVDSFLKLGIHSSFFIFSSLVILAYALTEAMSNAAAVAVLLPIGLALAQQFGLNPEALTVAIATAAGMTFLLPVSTPAMAIITSHPMCRPGKAFRYGLLLKLIGLLVLIGVFWFIWPLLNIHVVQTLIK